MAASGKADGAVAGLRPACACGFGWLRSTRSRDWSIWSLQLTDGFRATLRIAYRACAAGAESSAGVARLFAGGTDGPARVGDRSAGPRGVVPARAGARGAPARLGGRGGSSGRGGRSPAIGPGERGTVV